MKKLFVLAVVALMTTVSASAQQMFIKPMVGATLATFSGDVHDNKMKVGLVAGAEFGYNFAENMGVTAGLLYSMQGSAIKDEDPKYKLDYLNIPVLFNYYMKKFDLSVPMGLSYEISDFVIDARYNLGVSNILKDNKGFVWDGKGRNSVIMLTVGYKIPF